MAKKRGGGTPQVIYILYAILFVVLLKVFGVIPDQPEYLTQIVAGISAALGVVLSFVALFNKMFSFERRVTIIEERIGTLDKNIVDIKKELKEIKDKIK